MASCDQPWPPTCWYMMTSKHNHPLRPLNRPWARSFRLRTALRCFLGRHPRRSATAIIEPERVRTAMPHGETHPACSVISGTAHTSGVATCTGPHARFLKLAAHVNLSSNVKRHSDATHTGSESRSIEAVWHPSLSHHGQTYLTLQPPLQSHLLVARETPQRLHRT